MEALPLKKCERAFISHSKHFTYKVKLVRSPYLGLFMILFIQVKSKINKKRQVTSTYALMQSKILMEANK